MGPIWRGFLGHRAGIGRSRGDTGPLALWGPPAPKFLKIVCLFDKVPSLSFGPPLSSGPAPKLLFMPPLFDKVPIEA